MVRILVHQVNGTRRMEVEVEVLKTEGKIQLNGVNANLHIVCCAIPPRASDIFVRFNIAYLYLFTKSRHQAVDTASLETGVKEVESL